MSTALRVVTWNLERKRPDRGLGAEAVERLFGWSPDLAVVTESRTTAPEGDGRWFWPDEPPPGDRFAPEERKVGVWTSRAGESIDLGAGGPDPTRIVAIRLLDPAITVLGVCIPWHFAGVRERTDRLWEQHLRFLEALGLVVAELDGPVVVAGDFNQRVPRAPRGAKAPAEAMQGTFADFDIVTAGVPEGVEKQGIDHIALSRGLEASSVWGWSGAEGGRRYSDHDGAGAVVIRR